MRSIDVKNDVGNKPIRRFVLRFHNVVCCDSINVYDKTQVFTHYGWVHNNCRASESVETAARRSTNKYHRGDFSILLAQCVWRTTAAVHSDLLFRNVRAPSIENEWGEEKTPHARSGQIILIATCYVRKLKAQFSKCLLNRKHYFHYENIIFMLTWRNNTGNAIKTIYQHNYNNNIIITQSDRIRACSDIARPARRVTIIAGDRVLIYDMHGCHRHRPAMLMLFYNKTSTTDVKRVNI